MRTPAWGIFCACSWTWCIGMYLPIIMLDRFGWPGFLVFAVPNVVGCTLFGYLLRDRAASMTMVAQHATAMRGFSAVTIAFHLFFAGFIVLHAAPACGATALPAWTGWAAPLALLAVALGAAHFGDRAWLIAAAAVYALSLATFAGVGAGQLGELPVSGADGAADLAWIAPVIVFGFMGCPWVDATFHRARQRAPSRHAFAVFGIAFAVMIILTAACWPCPPHAVLGLVAGHLAAQSIFTVGAHVRELRSGGAGIAWIIAPLAALALLPAVSDLVSGQAMYLRFLVFYGLLFPAYALVFMGPRPLARPRGAALALFALAILVAAPLYELAFLHGREVLLALVTAGIMITIVVRLRRARS